MAVDTSVSQERFPNAQEPRAARTPGTHLLGLRQVLPRRDLACGNGTIRTPHPCELFGDDWLEWSVLAAERRGSIRLNAAQATVIATAEAAPARPSAGVFDHRERAR